MAERSLVGSVIDRVRWKLDRKRRWVADLRREAQAREEGAAEREAELRSALGRADERVAALEARLEAALPPDLQSELVRLPTELRAADGRFAALEAEARSVSRRLVRFDDAVLRLDAQARSNDDRLAAAVIRDRRIATIEQVLSETLAPRLPAPEPSGRPPLFSIILPVFNRRRLLADAVASVCAQDFASWELIVVDDGSREDVASVVEGFHDDRIRFLRRPRLGAAGARNAGLREARGELIAYLDSDNLWYPWFLSGMAAAMNVEPRADLAYGVLVTEAHGLGDRRLLFEPFDRDTLLNGNFIDLNVVAHRAELVAKLGGFDEALDRLIDWDLVLRYSEGRSVRAVPVLGARYRVLDEQRITDVAPVASNEVAIRSKWYPPQDWRTAIRVLFVVWHYPQLSETYIETEIRQLRRWGVHVEVWRAADVAAPYPTNIPVHSGTIADAVEKAQPDLVHVHWLGFALDQDEVLSGLGLPVTVRLHGFDTTRDGLGRLLAKPWLAAIYAFPAQARIAGPDPRVRIVPAAFETALFRPSRSKDRRLIVRAGAALPSKDIPFAFDLAKRLPAFRFVYAGITAKNVERYADELMQMRARMESPIDIQWNLPREDVAALIGRAGVYLHTINPPDAPHAAPLGMPVSIAEAMATGAFVVYRQSPEFDAYVGEAGRAYRSLDEAAEILAETERWSEQDWERAANRSIEQAYRGHADSIVYRTILEDWLAIVYEGRDRRAG